ncbi:DMT family transporter [Cytophagaceae bacterium DM2B3-1]|uniref:DMT family transporter n=1 Tax=Xanthocytophaga flava TaxID=3048013 RepID=A0ABT7CSZ9_9BACT|nr:DMT family transporter [Xanthocytophaga flavus]MDJ1471956.1 DMT family transporter [Xanthocytophaga flavus]MDJ1496893.1 DMT family transporter [Xanthocytophaga flavus]
MQESTGTSATPSLQDYLQLHFLVIIWGFTAILGRLITIPAVELVVYRTLLASILLGIICFYRKKELNVGTSVTIQFFLTGSVIALHWILFFAAARVANVSVCLAGMATGSLWTSLLEPLVQRRKVRLLEIGLGIIAIAGLYVVFRFEFTHALGLGMAVISAMLAALFSVINSRFAHIYDAQVVTFYEMMGACLSASVLLPLFSVFFYKGEPINLIPVAWDWLWIVLLAWVCTVYAYSMGVSLLRKFTPFAINLTINLEPVYGIVLAVLIFGEKERMTPGFYAGTAIILLAVLIYPLLKSFQAKNLRQNV